MGRAWGRARHPSCLHSSAPAWDIRSATTWDIRSPPGPPPNGTFMRQFQGDLQSQSTGLRCSGLRGGGYCGARAVQHRYGAGGRIGARARVEQRAAHPAERPCRGRSAGRPAAVRSHPSVRLPPFLPACPSASTPSPGAAGLSRRPPAERCGGSSSWGSASPWRRRGVRGRREAAPSGTVGVQDNSGRRATFFPISRIETGFRSL